MAYKNPASNSNYVNKDFQKIFPEMLDLVKKLTYKWDPSISNESDPGVILLKLNAIISDKSNYNIDKSVLEFFPETVTQKRNAYSSFKQLGYYPKWIISSETKLSIQYKGTAQDGKTVSIPRFTQFCDESDSIVYTIHKSGVTLDIGSDKKPSSVDAIQGKINYYSINGDDRIRFSDLDSNRRLYFDEINVAQNGIFISLYDTENYDGWKITDNVYSEELTSASGTVNYYSFGLSQDLGRCYIEFAEDIEEHIEGGIKIRYITSDGYDGNVPINTITRLKDNLDGVKVSGNDDATVDLNSDTLIVRNISAGLGGEDEESIDSMYINYKRVVGTFNTLVSLRDYINYILRTGLVSNGFVCDRSNDIQSTSKIITLDNGIDVVESVVLGGPTSPELTAFDLRMYLNTNNTDPLDTLKAYQSTFDFVPSSSTTEKAVINKMTDEDQCKCILHDFSDIIQSDPSDRIIRFCGFRNKYKIECKIVPQYSVTESERDEIISNIRKEIFERFNASKIEYGSEASYDDIYNAITESDSRIKTVYLSDFDYHVFGVYWNGFVFKEINIDDVEEGENARNNIMAKSILAGKTSGIIKDKRFDYKLTSQVNEVVDNVQYITPISDVEWENDSTNNASVFSVQNSNENIIFYTPSYSNEITYSTYMRYKYTGANVSSGSQHQLSNGESLTLYWKENSSASYKSTTYVSGATITTNFNMSQTSYSGEINDSTIANNIGNLNSDKTISILGKNEITLDENTKCYWILNNKTDDMYVLFSANSNEYMLKSGEYFAYTNQEETILEILGSGTVIKKSGTAVSNWAVKIISSENLLDGGLSYDIPWLMIPEKLTATEMNIFTFGDGMTLRIVDSSGQSRTPSVWEGNKEINISSDATIQYIETPVDGTEIDWNNSKSLTKISSDVDFWRGVSVLNVNMSPVSGQKLEPYHRIEINNNESRILGNESQYVMSSTYLEFPGSNIIDVRAYDFGNNTYSNISLMGYNVSNYSCSNDSMSPTIGADGSYTVSIPYDEGNINNSSSYYINFSNRYLTGNYAFSIVNSNSDISISNINVSRDNCSINSNLSGSSTFKYFSIDVDQENSSKDGTLSIEIVRENKPESNASEVVTINSLFKYDMGNLKSGVVSCIDELDGDGIFDIGYDVDTDTEIENPTDPVSFFDPNHIYNKFTLPYIDNTSIKLTNVR